MMPSLDEIARRSGMLGPGFTVGPSQASPAPPPKPYTGNDPDRIVSAELGGADKVQRAAYGARPDVQSPWQPAGTGARVDAATGADVRRHMAEADAANAAANAPPPATGIPFFSKSPEPGGGWGGGGTPAEYGFSPESRRVEQGTKVSDATRTHLDNAAKERSLSTEYAERADVQSAEATQGRDQKAAAMQAIQAGQAADAEKTMAAKRDAATADLKARFDAVDAMQVDPERYWGSRSTAQRVMGFVGVALGGFLEGSRGTPNRALQMIDHAIDNDIAAQREQVANARAGYKDKVNLYGEYVAQLGSERLAAEKLRADQYKQVMSAADAAAAGAGRGSATQAKYMDIRAELEAKQADTGLKLDQLTADHVSNSERYGLVPGTGGGWGGGGAAPAKKLTAADAKASAKALHEADMLEKQARAFEHFGEARSGIGGLVGQLVHSAGYEGAHGDLTGAQMETMVAHGVRPTDSHMPSLHQREPGAWTPGGAAEIQRQIASARAEAARLRAQAGGTDAGAQPFTVPMLPAQGRR